MSDKLLGCPFCGGEAEYVGQEGMGYWVQCASCDARGPWGDYGYQAMAAWNRRTPTPEQAGQLGDLPSRLVGWSGKARSQGRDRIELNLETVDRILAALRAPREVEKENADARREVSALITSIWRAEFRHEAPNWKPLPDLVGMITQLDNMYAGVRSQRDEARHALAALQSTPPAQPTADAVERAIEAMRPLVNDTMPEPMLTDWLRDLATAALPMAGDYVMVPREPTKAMLSAAIDEDCSPILSRFESHDDVREVWDTMIAASPTGGE